MSLLKFVDSERGPVGSFSWFPVHGTSMNRTNQLISGDNKGAAARFMEDWFQRRKLNATHEDAGWVDFVQHRGAATRRSSTYGMYA